ncbi:MAG TPA: PspC domain-containing protein [Chloroflexota bacterium]|jgi:phage shock protein C|nr:PspC domain-containing protein [Chloroflexota bacterium]
MTVQTGGTARPKLRRSVRDRMLGGVCGGLGEYFGIDPVLVRLAFVLTTLAGGAGVLAYLIMLIAVPCADAADAGENAYTPIGDRARWEGKQIAAIGLMGVGALLLLGNLGWLSWLRGELVWPVLLMALGAAILLSRRSQAV